MEGGTSLASDLDSRRQAKQQGVVRKNQRRQDRPSAWNTAVTPWLPLSWAGPADISQERDAGVPAEPYERRIRAVSARRDGLRLRRNESGTRPDEPTSAAS
jgi:hypothetical protein